MKFNADQVQKDIEKYVAKFSIPEDWRDDAIQEGWVAFLEGKSFKEGVLRYIHGEREYEQHYKAEV